MENEKSKYQEVKDKIIQCLECKNPFTWSSGEQFFYLSKSPPLQPPKHCPKCRLIRKLTIANQRGEQ